MRRITTYLQLERFLKAEKAVAFYFYSDDCPVCQALRPKVEQLFTHRFPLVALQMINLQQAVDLTEQLQIYTVPVLIVCFDGKEQIRKTRCWGIDELDQELSRPYGLMVGENG